MSSTGRPSQEPDLATLQRWLQQLTLDPVDAATGAHASDLVDSRRVERGEIVPPSAGLEPFERLQIYNNAYVSRLIEVLEADFIATKYALGEEWESIAMAAVYAHPSRVKNLNPYGSMLPEFLEQRTEAPNADFVAQLARLEWSMTEAFDAPEFEPFDLSTAHGRTESEWADAVFITNPSLRVHDFTYPLLGYLRAVLEEETPTVPESRETSAAIYRKDRIVWRVDLPRDVAAILQQLIAGTTFAGALAAGEEVRSKIAEPPPEPLDVGKWFQQWATDGLFVDVRFGSG